jgi:hypothetical protein
MKTTTMLGQATAVSAVVETWYPSLCVHSYSAKTWHCGQIASIEDVSQGRADPGLTCSRNPRNVLLTVVYIFVCCTKYCASGGQFWRSRRTCHFRPKYDEL